MSIQNKNLKKSFPINRREAWLFMIMAFLAIVACTNDLDQGNPLGPSSFGILVSPSSAQINKGDTQQFTALGGVSPVTWAVSTTTIGNIDAGTGLFTALQIAGSATITALDAVGDTGTGTITVLPNLLVIAPGSATANVAGSTDFTATLASGSNLVVASIARDDSSGTLTLPTLTVAANVVTATYAAVPTSGSETFTITITDTNNGDVGAVKLTLTAP
ncbi:hypothetical protein UR09_03390 [Candidatus Nitromaritima sp. SCGC AAA799-A02]|nr:hypothetical protein UZ36_06405 [Candidatus Nitromaritima sp. SCGC AAA799-C22]KMP11414.1 hypothetical protein UR09_03390 [Candidatus Nitromaritima sp. SCGC AAA799-A02]